MADAAERERPIVELLKAGRKSEAFDLLFVEYARKLYHLALAILRNHGEAEDATQDALLKVWRALPSYNGSASFSTWIYVIARNTCFTRLARNRPQLPLAESDHGPPSQSGGAGASPIDSAIDCERILEQLPQDQGRVMTLFYLEGRSTDEVSKMLDMAPATVRSHLHRARKRAAKLLLEGTEK